MVWDPGSVPRYRRKDALMCSLLSQLFPCIVVGSPRPPRQRRLMMRTETFDSLLYIQHPESSTLSHRTAPRSSPPTVTCLGSDPPSFSVRQVAMRKKLFCCCCFSVWKQTPCSLLGDLEHFHCVRASSPARSLLDRPHRHDEIRALIREALYTPEDEAAALELLRQRWATVMSYHVGGRKTLVTGCSKVIRCVAALLSSDASVNIKSRKQLRVLEPVSFLMAAGGMSQ